MGAVLLVSITTGSPLAIAIWLISQAGLMLLFFTFEIGGKLIYPIFLILADWPNFIVSLFLPKELPNSFYQNAYPVSCITSFIGWFILANLLSFVWYSHVYFKRQRERSRADH